MTWQHKSARVVYIYTLNVKVTIKDRDDVDDDETNKQDNAIN